MFLGIDIGTSSVKAILVDERQEVVATRGCALTTQSPRPGFSEQAPDKWLEAVYAALDGLKREHPAAMSAVAGIGLSGHMHGATMLGRDHRPLRSCILWNDTRSSAQCRELERRWPELRQVTGNKAMPGFTAPKVLWVAQNEPDIFAATSLVLLPKAYVRLVMTGEAFEDMSDASGSLWLDVRTRAWSVDGLAATGLSREQMPRLVEGLAPTARLRPDLASRWGMIRRPVFAGGAGDNLAGAVGIGAIDPGSAFISLGTSGTLVAPTTEVAANPNRTAHSFCHAVPGRWVQAGVTLSAASSLSWVSRLVGVPEGELLAPLGTEARGPSPVSFLPYLSGERTPHDDAAIRGSLHGLSHASDRSEIAQAVLEGVAFSLADCRDVLAEGGVVISDADTIGGGSRSRLWLSIIANVLNIRIHRLAEGETGAAFGAARLARLATTDEPVSAVCTAPPRVETVEPDPEIAAAYAARLACWRGLFRGGLSKQGSLATGQKSLISQ